MTEVWSSIVGYEGVYSVSDLGRVKRDSTGRMLTPNPGQYGYPSVCLSRHSKVVRRSIHRLVLEAFVGPCPVGMEAAHNDGCRTNARLANLRWATPAENNADKHAHGTLRVGENHPLTSLTSAQVMSIRADQRRQRVIAREYGVHQATISNIKRGFTWSHI